jgi:hypothetical protein
MHRAAEIDHSAAVIAYLEQKASMELSKLRLDVVVRQGRTIADVGRIRTIGPEKP